MDMISNLPDSILSHILSLLPTKLAASTCVLSKRWQFLWTMLHNLDLDCDTDQLQKDEMGRTVRSFVNFVNKFFIEHDKDLCIKRFRLQFGSSCSSINVDSWVLAAIASDVEELDLNLCLPYSFEHSCSIGELFLFRCSLHTCKTLVVLKLNGIVVDAPPSSIHFPSLKVLRLFDINFLNHDSFGNLFYGCPVLEKLALAESSEFEDLGGYVISSPTLRELVVGFGGEEASTCLWVEAPSLEYLNVEIFVSRDVYLKDLDNLVQAVVSLHLNGHSFEVDELHMVEHAFAALHNVQILKMKEFTMQAIFGASFENLPLFRNLIQLEIEEFCCFWRMLLSLLRKLPYLQHLTLYLYCCSTCGDFLGSEAWVELDVLNCLSHLRTFCFYGAFGWDDDNDHFCDDMGFLTYVLKNSVVLENVTITYQRGTLCSNLKRVVQQKLASLERGSKKCQLQFEGEVL